MKKILIVDDQQGIRLLLNEVFKKEGYETYLAANGLEAIHFIENIMIDCMLLDMKIPGMNGIEILQHMHEMGQKMPIIMMTAYGEVALVEQAKSLGVIHYFTKPFDIFEVRNTVNNLFKD
ncbi:response regulator [Kurthia sibirica]|uniref:Two-component system response regulator n=1 Tax=Kurthia sibirica TaxID=202750 RepID=A0A2U3AKW3_9BACL|nr:response regulator [Kurthia sibirica]PWI25159.1 two-component system response regulator [Kurthia sibirica]GEK33245.1 response regulator [Kurthia sibirica]